MTWRCPGRRSGPAVALLLALATGAHAEEMPAERRSAVSVSASVDQTEVDVGEQLTLTITLSGDLSGARLDPVTMPPALAVAGRSHSQNIRIVGGRMERSEQIIYVLVAREPGACTLGPFQLRQRGRAYATEPLQVDVRRPPAPPPTSTPAQRLTI